ncbi:MAG TPA: hypothetical protein VG389_28635 [Myxococcota bacterium]|nr:hypothetical protein [Myxococcota bacterium]
MAAHGRAVAAPAALALALGVACLAPGAAGCRRGMNVTYEVGAGVDLAQLQVIEVRIEGVAGSLDVTTAEASTSPLGVQFFADPAADTYRLVIDFLNVLPEVVPGMVVKLKAPKERPHVRFVGSLSPAAGVPLCAVITVTPDEADFAPGTEVTVHVDRPAPDAGPACRPDAGTGTDASTGTDAAPGNDGGG